ncbi:golgin subfamily A member 7 isoform X2 [Lingula anatina]|nr:golgin subfamily A member 7 isoform X2 [Lingula anatina]|eukprot:XP_013414437.1 golgin subfamily A member 7 isoform X2 [Lingula anatina]
MDDLNRIPTHHSAKIFLHRDFSDGTPVRFQNKFPQELQDRIDSAQFTATVNHINEIYSEAESLGSRTYCESCFACLSAYFLYLCIEPHYTKCIKKAARYIEEQNKNVYLPKGLMIVDPAERGLRVLEIVILSEIAVR